MHETNLPFQKLTVSDAYYKRYLYVYNFGIHDNETIASRGSQEFFSCLAAYFTRVVSTDQSVKHIVVYSDSCAGQNRNMNVVLTLMRYVQTNNTSIDTIEQTFLVSGHSYLPNDCDFGCNDLYVPKDWYDIMAQLGQNKKFVVHAIQCSDIVSVKRLQNCTTRRRRICMAMKLTEKDVSLEALMGGHHHSYFLRKQLEPVYPTGQTVTSAIKKDIMD
ncbi:hypothetical protein PR048_004870 [Dryococelus australis]|uniref:Uncharacterized protein n=1 Tax=Dryococelus australis TaxID=614101 RepID=A0ABQ9I6M4_9NEOP|nr:hypothetical protein PR048_004870 [Dryococelus australis]